MRARSRRWNARSKNFRAPSANASRNVQARLSRKMEMSARNLSARSIASGSPSSTAALWEHLSDAECEYLAADWHFWARDEQLPPPGDWRIWLLMGGRGSGKTRAGAEWIADGIREGRMQRVALIGATHHDARSIMIEGESGLLSVSEGARYEPSLRRITWPSGAVASVLSADEADSIRTHRFRISEIDDTSARAIQAVATDPSIYN